MDDLISKAEQGEEGRGNGLNNTAASLGLLDTIDVDLGKGFIPELDSNEQMLALGSSLVDVFELDDVDFTNPASVSLGQVMEDATEPWSFTEYTMRQWVQNNYQQSSSPEYVISALPIALKLTEFIL